VRRQTNHILTNSKRQAQDWTKEVKTERAEQLATPPHLLLDVKSQEWGDDTEGLSAPPFLFGM
jgi:hypothetical protein